MRDGIAHQHRRLEGFLEEIAEALLQGDRRRSEIAAFRLQGALNAHFDVEELVVFPSLRATHVEIAADLAALEAGHGTLRAALATICVSVVASDAQTARVLLDDFREALAEHERIEEALMDRGVATAGKPVSHPGRRTRQS